MKLIPFIMMVFIPAMLHAQDCRVLLKPISKQYEGECEKGKAQGRGKASGTDRYEGQFSGGYPDGMGSYYWQNGDRYEGEWEKGKRDGYGRMYYAGKTGKDSLLTGYWKKDRYIGQYEKPYEIHGRTPTMTRVSFSRSHSGEGHEVTIRCESITGGANTPYGQIPKPVITNIDIAAGQFQTQTSYDNMPKTAMTTFRGVIFPLRLRVYYGTDMIDFEIYESGSWVVDLGIQR